MAQVTKIVDVTRSFLPVDPDAFPQNMMYTEQSDSPEKEPPILAIEGQNFMPTSYGYRSFFGQNSILSSTPLPDGTFCDKVLLFQFSNYRNILVALCADGIYTNSLDTWVHEITLVAPAAGTILEWTHALIENTLYLYRQGNANVYSIDYTGLSIVNFPTVPLSFIIPGTPAGLTGSGTTASPYLLSALVDFTIQEVAVSANPDNLLTIAVTGPATPALADAYLGIITAYNATAGTNIYPIIAAADGSVIVSIPAQRIDHFSIEHYMTGACSLSMVVADSLGAETVDLAIASDAVSSIYTRNTFDGLVLGRGFASTPYSFNLVGVDQFVEFRIPSNISSMGVTTDAAVTVFDGANTIPLPAGTNHFISLVGVTLVSISGVSTSANVSIVFTAASNYNVTVNTLTPTFLNMTGQMGIFRANGRLGFWDSANSISWSSLFDHMDQTPSLETLAGNATFNAIVGRIVTILPKGDGFVVYSTKSIVGVRYSAVDNILWDASSITNEAGIAFPSQVTTGITDQDHFAFTNSGIKKIGAFNQLAKTHAMEDALTDLYDFLKESRSPVRLDLINGRYLLFSLIDTEYLTGRTMFTTVAEESVTFRVLLNSGEYDGYVTLPVYIAAEDWVFGTGGTALAPDTLVNYTADIFSSVPFTTFSRFVTQWRAQGEKMIPSAELTPVDPYSLNMATYTHTPNTIPALDIAPFRSGLVTIAHDEVSSLATRQAAFTELLSTTEKTPQLSLADSFKELGWVFPRNLVEGVMDRNLHEYLYYQHLEWEYFSAFQTALANSLGASPIPPSSVTEDLGLLTVAEVAALPVAGSTINTLGYLYTASPTYNPINQISGGLTYYSADIAPVAVGLPNWETDAVSANYKATKTATYETGRRVIETVATSYVYKVGMEIIGAAFPTLPAPWVQLGVGGSWEKDSSDLTVYEIVGTEVEAAITQRLQELFNSLPSTAIATTGILAGLPVTKISLGTPTIIPVSSVYMTGIRIYAEAIYGNLPALDEWKFFIYVEIEDVTVRDGVVDEILQWRTIKSTTKTVTAQSPAAAIPVESQLLSSFKAYQDRVDWSYIRAGTTNDGGFSYLTGAYSIPAVDIASYQVAPVDLSLTYPGATFTLQDGSLAPYYPTYKGALVLDLGLKKWGKMVADFKTLVDYQPINQAEGAINYTNFSFDIGFLDANGDIGLFDSATTTANSWLTYGKPGYYRQGMTELAEVRTHFRRASTGELTVMPSLDGRALALGWENVTAFSNAANVIGYPNLPGRWHAIKISGNYDLTYMELRGTVAGRR